MKLSEERRAQLLQKIVVAEGFASVEELIGAVLMDSVSPAICTDCELVCEMEPDQTRGYCESCGQNRVIAAPILAGII
jgi:hypothetical protein